MIRILVVDDHPIVRKGLFDLFREEPGMTVCGEAANVTDALNAATTLHPDVAVVDLTLGTESGLDLLAALARLTPPVAVLVLTGHDEQLYAERVLKAGALGYVMKDRGPEMLVEGVRRVAAGKAFVSADTSDRILSTLGSFRRTGADQRSAIERLSDREHQVLTLVAQGRTTREMAAQLTISVKTVESHLARLKDKLGARNGKELTRLAMTLLGTMTPPAGPRS